MYDIISGKWNGYYYQGCKGGKIQRKVLPFKGRCIENPTDHQIHYRKQFHEFMRQHNFTTRQEMYDNLKAWMADHPYKP